MENKQNNNKMKFTKKQGIYVVLVVCLCLIAVFAAVKLRKTDSADNTVDNSNSTLINNKVEGTNEIEDAEFVNKDNSQDEVASGDKYEVVVSEEKFNDEGESVSANAGKGIKLEKPIDGKVVYPFRNGNTGVTDKTDKTNKTPRGIGINAEMGTEVKAAADGVVEYVGKDSKFGNVVVIKHKEGLKTVYGNLDKDIKVKEKDKVKVGDVIGKVGDSAAYFNNIHYKPHLHFEILDGNKEYKQLVNNFDAYVNPMEYIDFEK